jgi:hypothetical protein
MRQAVPKLNAGGAGWTLQGTTAPLMNSNSMTLSSGLLNTSWSVFYNAPLNTPAFTASIGNSVWCQRTISTASPSLPPSRGAITIG